MYLMTNSCFDMPSEARSSLTCGLDTCSGLNKLFASMPPQVPAPMTHCLASEFRRSFNASELSEGLTLTMCVAHEAVMRSTDFSIMRRSPLAVV